ncbi:helix-turn-helix domain-containing protein [Pseudonocardia sp. CA-107938]|uniref:helix-turn-helix domain-containing protein n=1 Tax=Pseudonocardia sp. CA-107938 TaxID=3240021 RepID=UPI003D8CE54A
MSERPVSRSLGELGARLRNMRERAGATGAEFAELLGDGWRQSKISKIETGRQLPTHADIEAWSAATGSDPAPLIELRDRAAIDYRSHKDRIQQAGGVLELHDNLTALIESSTFVAEFWPALVPGLLQTATYMRDMDTASPAEDAEDGTPPETHGGIVAAKIRRQALLHEPGRQFVHVVTEAALRLRIGTISVTSMRAQLTHLAELATLPGHTFGVIPFTTPCPAPPANFAIYDRALVRIETAGGVLQLTDDRSVARYSRWLDLLVDAALTGKAAADFCLRVASSMED